MPETRTRDGVTLHDGGIYDPSGCPRGRADCSPLSRIASRGYESFMCCGQTSAAPVPTDRLRLCIKSTHAAGVDPLVNFDERDAVHTSAVLLGGLASLGSVCITATDSEPTAAAGGAAPAATCQTHYARRNCTLPAGHKSQHTYEKQRWVSCDYVAPEAHVNRSGGAP